jgi:hypothetical protein
MTTIGIDQLPLGRRNPAKDAANQFTSSDCSVTAPTGKWKRLFPFDATLL